MLKSKLGGKVDRLYLDDTFCDPAYEFPPRAEAGTEVLDIIRSVPEDYKILIGMDSLGKEELLVAIALMFKTLIVVDEERLRTLSAMRRVLEDMPDVFTHDPRQGRVIALPKKEVNYRTVMRHRMETPTIGICPSGWSTTLIGKSNERTPLTFHPNKVIYRVPYSLHSSYSELVLFVKALKPRSLFSVSLRDNVHVRKYLGMYCSMEPVTPIDVPHSVKVCMESKRQALTMSGIPSGRVNDRSATAYALSARSSPSPLLSRKSMKGPNKRGAVILASPPRPKKRNSDPTSSNQKGNEQIYPETVDLTGDSQDIVTPLFDISTQSLSQTIPNRSTESPTTIIIDDSQFENSDILVDDGDGDDDELADALAILFEDVKELPSLSSVILQQTYDESSLEAMTEIKHMDDDIEELLAGVREENIDLDSQLLVIQDRPQINNQVMSQPQSSQKSHIIQKEARKVERFSTIRKLSSSSSSSAALSPSNFIDNKSRKRLSSEVTVASFEHTERTSEHSQMKSNKRINCTSEQTIRSCHLTITIDDSSDDDDDEVVLVG